MWKIKSKRQKPKPFLEDWESGDKVVENDVCEHDGVEEEQSLDARERNENPFWNQYRKRTFMCSTRVFCDWIKSRASRQGQPPEHLKENL